MDYFLWMLFRQLKPTTMDFHTKCKHLIEKMVNFEYGNFNIAKFNTESLILTPI